VLHGDTVDVAARLAAQGPAGRIYATGDFRRNSKASFQVTGPIRVYRLAHRGAQQAGASSGRLRPEYSIQRHDQHRMRW
jgi:class 3 adenylate cyclase